MKKHLFLILALAFATPIAMQAQASRDMWDFINSFACSTGRQHGVVYDGEYIYTSAWGKSSTVLSMFYKYDLEGNLIEEFDVPGVTNSDDFLRDMTFDGEYFYGCDAHSGKIWCYDLHNKTLVGQINTSLNELGTCTYDPDHDAFWVGERATGSTPNLLLDLKLVDRNGTVISTATAHNLGGHTVHGTGRFVDEDGTPHLYLFAVEGFTAHVFDYNIEDDSMDPNYIFDFASTPGWSYACSAGGAYIGECNGSICFFGDVDKAPTSSASMPWVNTRPQRLQRLPRATSSSTLTTASCSGPPSTPMAMASAGRCARTGAIPKTRSASLLLRKLPPTAL